ncbi:MAG TPA: FlgO family outer membrane protein [Phycisphaerales bacterium]|nr:FlgO family outer membrane protein [Phycisphaerales bacterium]
MLPRLSQIALALILLARACSLAHAQAGEKELAELATKLSTPLIEKQKPKVTAIDFTDIKGRPNELGRYWAEQLAVELVGIKGMTVLDRANIASIMAEHQLTADGLVKPENAKKLGQFAGVDAIVIGSMTEVNQNVVLTVRVISAETAELVAAGRANVPVTNDLRKMLGLSVAQAISHGAAGSGLTATQGDEIAVREVGPLTVTLRNVVKHVAHTQTRDPSDSQAVPSIRCTFDLTNRDLQRSVVFAANQKLGQMRYDYDNLPTMAGLRGEVVDSAGNRWRLLDARGISAVCAFETGSTNGSDTTTAAFAQSNPGGIVDAIRTAAKCEGLWAENKRYWSGSLDTIGTGETVRMTVDFVPTAPPEPTDRWEKKAPTPYAWPTHFQFDMELVLGTFAENEDPLKAKDLRLRNLTIDRIDLPIDVSDSEADK